MLVFSIFLHIPLSPLRFLQGSPNASPLLQAASSACEVVWDRGLLTRIGLCHGIAGNTYAFLSLHRALQAFSTPTPSLSAPSSHQPAFPHYQQQQQQALWRARAFASFLLCFRPADGYLPKLGQYRYL